MQQTKSTIDDILNTVELFSLESAKAIKTSRAEIEINMPLSNGERNGKREKPPNAMHNIRLSGLLSKIFIAFNRLLCNEYQSLLE